MERIELAIFDIGGTIVDPGCLAPALALEDAFNEVFDISDRQEEVSNLIQTHMGMGKSDHILLMLNELGYDPKLLEVVYAEFDGILSEMLSEDPEYVGGLVPNIDMVFEELRENDVKVYLTTGYSKEMVDDIFMNPNCDLPLWLYPRVLTSSHKIPGRPSPFMIFEAMKITSTHSVSKVVSFGDTVNDIRSAVNAGVIAVGVNTGVVGLHRDRREAAQIFLDAGADYVIDDLDGLPWLFGRLEEIDFSRPIMTGTAAVVDYVNYFPHP